MRYRKPEKMKESGIGWIGKIPRDWSLRRLKIISAVNSSNVDKKSRKNEIAVELCNYTDVYYNEFITNNLDFMNATASGNNIKRFRLEENDVIITKDSESKDDIAVPALVKETKENLLCGYHLALIKPNNKILRGDYLFRLFQSKKYREEFGNRSNGITRYGLGVHELKNVPIYLPPIPEQRSIATFLERKTEAIDALIRKKEQLIERLKEKRQALITQAVTEGLDPDVPMKDSGIEWLGEIPEHWEIAKVRRFLKDQRQGYYTTDSYTDNGVKFLRITDIDDFGNINLENAPYQNVKKDVIDDFSVNAGDFLFARSGTIGRFGVAKENLNAIFASYLIRFRFRNLNTEFLKYYFFSKFFRQGLFASIHGGANQNINAENVKNRYICIPPEEEQHRIAQRLSLFDTKFLKQIKMLENSIEKLKEYRQSLISAVVTGKVDVRSTYAEASADRDEVEVEDEVQKTQTANIYFKRRVLAAKILDDLHAEPTLGRRKLQKILYLLEKEIEAVELKGKYQKDAAGPFDNEMMRSIESQLEKAEWFKQVERENGYGYRYVPMIKKDEYKKYYNRYWGNINDEIEELVKLVRPEKTDLLSLVATLYACWNDFLLKEEEFDGKKLIYESRYNWHGEKKDIPFKEWAEALKWMDRNSLEPQGVGKLTKEKN